MQLRFYTVDAFADRPFAGNPAAIVLLEKELPTNLLQNIASEFHVPTTAFLRPLNCTPWSDCSRFGLRWFTPCTEVYLCGHATLAAAHVLFHSLGNKSNFLHFETAGGDLKVEKKEDEVVMDLPQHPPQQLSSQKREKCLRLAEVVLGGQFLKEVLFSPTTKKLLVRMADSCTRKDLETINPNMNDLLEKGKGTGVVGVIVTLEGDLHGVKKNFHDLGDFNFASRYFDPWIGLPEDAVCGSAHTVLGPYWADQLNLKELKCRQCSPRGGDLQVRVRDVGRIDIIGRGKTVTEGRMNI